MTAVAARYSPDEEQSSNAIVFLPLDQNGDPVDTVPRTCLASDTTTDITARRPKANKYAGCGVCFIVISTALSLGIYIFFVSASGAGTETYTYRRIQPAGCLSSQWECDNGDCISTSFKCDGDNDCGDNSDETSCPAATTRPSCLSSREWRCGNGRCVRASYKCDGDNDCGDNSDEADCPARGSRG